MCSYKGVGKKKKTARKEKEWQRGGKKEDVINYILETTGTLFWERGSLKAVEGS